MVDDTSLADGQLLDEELGRVAWCDGVPTPPSNVVDLAQSSAALYEIHKVTPVDGKTG